MLTVRAASQQIWMTDVCFGSKADILGGLRDVRFTPESGHFPALSRCLLWADFVAEVGCKLFWSVIPSL
jgi:hypothetical protein